MKPTPHDEAVNRKASTTAQQPQVITVRALRWETAAVLKRVQSSERPLVITHRGRRAAVMLSADAYERSERERHLLRLLVRGEHQITAGIGHDMDDVLAEADTILADIADPGE